MILIVFLHLFIEILRSLDARCTINPEYNKVIKSRADILLCTTADCEVAGRTAYLETERYYGCVVTAERAAKSSKSGVRLAVVRKAEAGNTLTNCFAGTEWRTSTAGEPCPVLTEFEFKEYRGMRDFDVYVISCGKFKDEIPFAQKPRIQFYGFDNENQEAPKKRPILHPTNVVKCVSNCKESSPTLTVTEGNSYITSKKNSFTVNDNIIINNKNPVISSVCNDKKQRRKLKFSIAICNENPSYVKILPPDKVLFTVGDSFSCVTDTEDCLQGLNSSITFTRKDSQVTKYSGATMNLAYEHVGDKIVLKCFAGLTVKKFDSRIVRVEQAPYNITITGLLKVLWFGRFLSCKAKGFPIPEITWIQTKGISVLRMSEYFLLIGPWDFSGNYTVTCEARNSKGVISKKVSFENYNARIKISESSNFFYIFIPLTTLLCVIIMISTMILTFQEMFFGVPLFSKYKAKSIQNKKLLESKTLESKLEN